MGEGCFGKVAKCQVNSTCELVAVKILKDEVVENVQHELTMLSRISTLNADHFNLVKFYERFEYFGCTCLVFELLVMDLLQFLRTELGSSMYVHQIRPIAKQWHCKAAFYSLTKMMLVALQGLQSHWIIHTDIKLDNVMLANHEDTPYKVKLIDFVLAIPSSAAKCRMQLQPIGSRGIIYKLIMVINKHVNNI
ncbi:homeodomain-interacting protein kinase 1-like [Gouania willdenowi]|uniref:homeodomain-interacting protein kinase 1-like n=1 Tax=Gouania willdenowi TaxID=441366 RepID=UPI0010552F99|nr:homeodomain-interacting protein kinase 1-like [Gouania willdenowi]